VYYEDAITKGSDKKQPSCEKCMALQNQAEKRCVIKGGGQEMVVMIV